MIADKCPTNTIKSGQTTCSDTTFIRQAMTDSELRQLVESNARAIKALSEEIGAVNHKVEVLREEAVADSRRIDAKIDRLADIVQGNYQRIVRAETGAVNNESAWLDAMTKIDQLEQRLKTLEGKQDN